jgi:hypothetical protein
VAIDRRSPQRFFAFFAAAEVQATAAVVFDDMTGVATATVEAPPAEPPVEGMIRRRHYRPPPKRGLPVIHAVAAVTLDDMVGTGRVRVLDPATRRRREEEELLILLEVL